jgi:phosphoenolpyruvate-protein kinase (PTS system EI component)
VLESPPLRQLFKDQVRAILRAAAVGPARILVPLVTTSEQLDFVTETIKHAREELAEENLEFAPDVPLGIMLEVAAAAAMADSWADQVDFFALGTNDLAASALGIDREEPVGDCAQDPLHPGLLRIIDSVVDAAHRAGKKVWVCGELASDPEGALALAALGVDTVSVAVRQHERVRGLLAGHSTPKLKRLAPGLLAQRTATDCRKVLREIFSSLEQSEIVESVVV